MAKTTVYQKGTAHRLVFENKVVQLAQNLYQVASATKEESLYYVFMGSPNACNCDWYKYESLKGVKNPVCSHIKAVRLFRGASQ